MSTLWTIIKAWLIIAWALPGLAILHWLVRAGLRWIRTLVVPHHTTTRPPRCTCRYHPLDRNALVEDFERRYAATSDTLTIEREI